MNKNTVVGVLVFIAIIIAILASTKTITTSVTTEVVITTSPAIEITPSPTHKTSNSTSFSLLAPIATSIKEKPKVNVTTDIDSDILNYLIEKSNESNYSLELLQGMIQLECEGTWDPNFIDNQDYGLMQINTCNHAHLRKVFKDKYPNFNILDYRVNIDCGIYILDMFHQELALRLGRSPTEMELLTAYNKGVYYVTKRTGTSSFNLDYYNAVIFRKEQYKQWNSWVNREDV